MKRVIFFLFIFGSFPLFAQRADVEKGDILFESYEFGQAARFYNDALDHDTDPELKQYLNGQLAVCYTRLFQYDKAEQFYSIVMGSGKEIKPEWYLEYGNVLKLNGKYQEAKQQFIKYRQYAQTAEAGAFIQSVEWAINNDKVANNNYRIFLTNLDISGQSLGYCYYGSGLIYCHGRNKIAGKNNAIFDINYAITEGNISFIERHHFFPKLNFKWNEISPSISKDESRIYFAANAVRVESGKVLRKLEPNKTGIDNYKIYVAAKRDAEFQDIRELPFNSNEYSCMHPCILEDGKTLFFASDKPGGFGGFDLYRSTLSSDSTWGEPVNLGPVVNSAENEIFPWVNGNLLFFSSKGFNGYGGYDIFVAAINKQYVPTGLKNIGLPVNSFRDDVAFITNDSGASGYFSSNRDNDNGADQVYFFKESQAGKIAFQTIEDYHVKNNQTIDVSLPIADPTFPHVQNGNTNAENTVPAKKTDTLSELTPQQKNILADEKITPESPVKPNSGYVVAATPVVAKKELGPAKSGPDTIVVVKNSGEMVAASSVTEQRNKVPAAPKDKKAHLKAQTQQMQEMTTVKEFPPILFEFNTADITTAQKQMADSLYVLYRSDRTQEIYIEAFTDSRGSKQYNLTLSKRRAFAVSAYLKQKGVPASKIHTSGMGENGLLNDCSDGVICTEEQHALNRRVIMKLVRR